MAEGKWISDLKEDMPVVAAAGLVLRVRLEAVGEYLPKAALEPDEDIEHVHQLRVSTRRAGAALRIFADCLPKKKYKEVRKTLRDIRRAAGAARDWDVFLDELAPRIGKGRTDWRAGIDLLLGIGHGHRLAAQPSLERLVKDRPPLDLDKLMEDVLPALGPPDQHPPPATLKELALPMLTRLLHDLDEAASGDLTDYDHLHQVRILGKHLRYAMEVFACCFSPAFRDEYYAAVEEMQEILGTANDSHVTGQRLEALKAHVQAVQPKLWKRYAPGLEGLTRYHQKRLGQQRKLFEAWRRRWQESGGEAALRRFLT